MPRQNPSTPETRYATARRPTPDDGYPQRIPIWEVIEACGTVNRVELLQELKERKFQRRYGAPLDLTFCRRELTDMCGKGWLKRVEG